MGNNKFSFLTFNQFGQEYMSLVIPLRIITAYSHVMVYGESEYGYQRKPEPLHFKKIIKYMLDPQKSKILPTSIILGVDKEIINKQINTKQSIKEIDFDKIKQAKIFRIVDGQHRIEGVRIAAEKDPSLNDYLFNVIILLIENSNRSSELNVFTDINSKAKRIRVDLAELANHNYEILENRIVNINKHIAIKIAYKLKEKTDSVWYKAIKFDIHSDVVLGVVGVNTFCESIEPIVAKYIEYTKFNIECDPFKLIEFTEKSAEILYKQINIAWDAVANKWQQCFSNESNYDEEQHLCETRYNKNCYIQKTLGVKSINGIFGEIVRVNGFDENALDLFEDLITSSRLKSDDWMAGRLFSGLSSESGVTKAKALIREK